MEMLCYPVQLKFNGQAFAAFYHNWFDQRTMVEAIGFGWSTISDQYQIYRWANDKRYVKAFLCARTGFQKLTMKKKRFYAIPWRCETMLQVRLDARTSENVRF